MNYQREDEYVVLHEEDPDLDTIYIKLPKLEEWYSAVLGRDVTWDEAITYVDGYGLEPEDQVFVHQKIPERLVYIYEKTFEKLKITEPSKYKYITDLEQEDIFREIESNQEYYEEEIKWIKKQIKRIYLGYWCFIKEKPTYINGPFYFFLNFWKLKNKNRKDSLADYRDYQRVIFTGYMHAHTETRLWYKHTVTYRDEESHIRKEGFNDWDALKNFEAELRARNLPYTNDKNIPGGYWRDIGRRTMNGVNFISGRRIAKTESACCFGTWTTIFFTDQLFVIQGLNKDQAVEKVFVHKIQTPFSKLPFFFRPYLRGKEQNKAGFTFLYDSEMSLLHRAGVVPDPLGSRVTPLSSNQRAADGEETNFVYIDEPGKELDKGSQERDIPALWYEVLKPASEIGEDIVGTCIMPTTVGDMESGGGMQFLRIVNESHYFDRNNNGKTPSGLFNMFLSGYYAIPGFIDKWGFTVMDTPKEPVLSNTGKWITIGSKQYHANEIASFEKSKNWDALNTHNRNYPPTFRAAFDLNMKGMGMTEQTIDMMKNRLSILKFQKNKTWGTIDFRWVGDSEISSTDIHGAGQWIYSYIPPKDEWNKKTLVTEEDGYTRDGTKGNIYAPHSSVSNRFILTFDPVKFDKINKVGKGGSTPAAAIYYKRDKFIDPDSKPREEWVSQDYVAFILKRTDDREEIYEEILKAAILYGAYIYPENNDANDFFKWIRRKGYDGYLLKNMNDKGELDKVPGVNANSTSINDMVTKMADFFRNNVNYMKIPHIIEDWLKMRGIDDLTNHDLAAATGWCQYADSYADRTGRLMIDLYKPIEILDSPDFF